MQFLHSASKFQSAITTQTANDGIANPHLDLPTGNPVKLDPSDLAPLVEHLKSGDLLSACRDFTTLSSQMVENNGTVLFGHSLKNYLPSDVVLQPILGQLLEGILIDDGRNPHLPTPLEFLKQMGSIGALRTIHYATVLLAMVKNGANTTSLVPVFDSAISFNHDNLREVMSEADEYLSLDHDVATPYFIAFLILQSKKISSAPLTQMESVLRYSPYPAFRYVERVLEYHGFSINLSTHILALLQTFSSKSLYTNNHTLRQAISAALARSATVETLTDLYTSVKASSPVPLSATVYNIFITTFMQLSHTGDHLVAKSAAFSAWDDMEASGITPSVIEWTNLMKAFSTVRDKSMILPLWEKMIKGGIFPDDKAWTVQIHALLEANMVKEGLESLRGMQSSDIVRPNTETINAVLDALLRNDHFPEAAKVLAVAERLGIPKDITTYNTLLVSLMKQQSSDSKKFDESIVLIRKMSASGIIPDVQTITLILDGMYKFSNPKPKLSAVISLIRFCESVGISINVWTFTSIIRALLVEGREDAAIDMLLVMESRGMTGSSATYTVLLKHFFLKRDLSSVDELLEEMLQKRVVMDRRLWREVIVGFAGAGQANRMKSAIARMHESATAMGTFGFMSTLNRLGAKGLLVDAKELVEDLLDRGIVGRSLEARSSEPEKVFWEVVAALGEGAVMRELISAKRVDI